MSPILDLELEIILFLQSLGEWLVAPMKFFSYLGQEDFFLTIMPVIYWCVDAAAGLRVALALVLTNGLNWIFKLAFHGPRPFWIDPQVEALWLENSFGLPSGHAQIAATVWGSLAASLRRKWIWIAVAALVFFIGLSRVVLGVHLPRDVVFGWLLGGLTLWFLLRLEQPVKAWLARRTLPAQVLAIFAASIAFLLVGGLVRLSLSAWTAPAEWAANAGLAYPDLEEGEVAFEPLATAGLVTSAGSLFGLSLGALLISRQGGFNAGGAWSKRLLRFLIGLAGMLIFWRGLALFLPAGEDFIALVFRYIRYALTGFWAIGLAPWLFIRLGLAESGESLKTVEPALAS
jgi:membrane-associated phospholipid phosphatase